MPGSNLEARITCSLTGSGGTSRKSLLPGILFVYVLNGDQDNFYVSLEEMAIHSSILAWKIPRTEQPGELQSIGSQRVGHD